MSRLKTLVKRLARRDDEAALRAEVWANAEIFIVSYPKSGRTWLRFLVGKALCLAYGYPDERIGDFYGLTKDIKAHDDPSIRITEFIHDSLDTVTPWYELATPKDAFRDKEVVLLVRDPRDVVVSYYFHSTRRFDSFDGAISDFVRDERLGVRKQLAFNKNWFENRNVPRRFTVVRYEDLHDDPRAVLRQMLALIGATLSEETLDAAIEYSSFDHMKRLETTGAFKAGFLQPGNADDPESFKVRKGEVGGHRDYLSDDDVAYIDACLREMEYPL